jgi:quinoprotein glucose dehydrogenase
MLKQLIADAGNPGSLRASALTALSALRDPQLETIATGALEEDDAELRAAARRVLARIRPETGVPELVRAVEATTLVERQSALESLASLRTSAADEAIAASMQRLLQNEVPSDTRLDVLEAARARRRREPIADLLTQYDAQIDTQDPVAAYRESLVGGNAERGARIFYERAEVSCLRCHKVDGVGGDVGPDLSRIGSQKERQYLLESIVDPNRTVAENFRSVILVTDDGRVLTGIIKHEDDHDIQLVTAEAQLITVAKDTIEERAEGQSAMPQDVLKQLTARDVRDLVEWLSTLRE